LEQDMWETRILPYQNTEMTTTTVDAF